MSIIYLQQLYNTFESDLHLHFTFTIMIIIFKVLYLKVHTNFFIIKKEKF